MRLRLETCPGASLGFEIFEQLAKLVHPHARDQLEHGRTLRVLERELRHEHRDFVDVDHKSALNAREIVSTNARRAHWAARTFGVMRPRMGDGFRRARS